MSTGCEIEPTGEAPRNLPGQPPGDPPTPALPHKGGGGRTHSLPPCGGGPGWGGLADRTRAHGRFWTIATASAALVGLALMVDGLWRTSATYDEVAYLRVAARWWRTGEQESITRMGSPLTFWKIQQAPVLWALDRIGLGALVDEPIEHQSVLLPLVRLGGLPLWLAALLLTAGWSRRMYGPRAMALAAWLFALSPNLLAHGGLATMETPLVAGTAGMFLLFWLALKTGDRRYLWATAALGGLAFSCKFTAAILPALLGLGWWLERRGADRTVSLKGPLAFAAVMVAAGLLVTGFALLPLSETTGPHPTLDGRYGPTLERWFTRLIETPIPQDWVGFATQMRHQRHGGPSYLLGERRMTGWWYYYFVALAVKVPLSLWLLVAGRTVLAGVSERVIGERLILGAIAGFLAITALGSTRNYGIRYLLPLAPMAIVWVSALAEAGTRLRALAMIGLAGQALAVASIHPWELSYFNLPAGGPIGGRRILADSNLDWGQGARELARLQRTRPEYRDLTLYYFGDTDPSHYGVVGTRHVIDAGQRQPGLPPRFEARTAFVAVSTSLQFGPWGPPGYFDELDGVEPLRRLDDGTIAIYRSADLPHSARRSSPPN